MEKKNKLLVSILATAFIVVSCSTQQTDSARVKGSQQAYSNFEFMSEQQERPPADVVLQAQNDLGSYVETINETRGDDDQVTEPKFVHGFHIYMATYENLLQATDISSVITETTQWNMLVVSQGEGQALFRMRNVSGQYEGVELGYRTIAKDFYEILRHWSVEEGYTHRFIEIFPYAEFIEISQDGQFLGFVPTTRTRSTMNIQGDFDVSTLVQSSEFLPQLQEVIQENMSMNL